MNNILKTSILFLIICSSITGCQMQKMRGQKLDDKSIAQMQEEEFTKDKIIEMIGSPTLQPTYSNNVWYYVYYVENKRAWFLPQNSSQQIVKLTFSDKNLLQDVAVLDNTQNNNVSIDSNKTPTYGTQKSALQKFVTNFGRFNVLSKREKKR